MAAKGQPKTGGRRKGTPNRATAEIKALAQTYGPDAIDTLAEIMNDKAAPEASRVAAIRELLDRGFGKVPQAVGGTDDLPPIKTSRPFDYSRLSKEALAELMEAADNAASESD